MTGKAILFVIMGLSSTLLYLNINFGNLSNIASQNVIEYYEYAAVQSAATSGANMACHEIFRNPTWTAGYSNKPFEGALINLTVQVLDTARNIRRINSVASKTIDSPWGSRTITRTVQVTLQPSNFSKFAYYSQSEGSGIYWTTGDTVYGPFHTQDYLRVSGRPYFYGSVTVKNSLQKKNYSDAPVFLGGYEEGVDLPINEDAITALGAAADAAGFRFPTSYTYTYKDRWGNNKTGTENIDTVYLQFAGDYIKYKYNYSDSWTSRTASTFSPNGVIFIDNAVLRIQGTVKGKYTVACSGSNTYGKGDIYLDDNLVYNTNPVTNPNSTDLLGLVAQNDVVITDNNANSNDIKINASIYCQNGGFGAQNYSTRGDCGNIYLVGGIIQKTRAAVGTFNSYGITAGFNKLYRYDDRFMFNAPPKFPNTGSYEILSWYE